MHIGYARVSTQDQDLRLQYDALHEAQCDKIYEDKASGAHASRDGLTLALETVREGDCLVVLITLACFNYLGHTKHNHNYACTPIETMNTDASQTLTIPRHIMAPFYKSENLFRNIYGKDIDRITLGGGTVLAMHWQHRVSTDLDYFLNPQNLTGKENISLINNAADYLEKAAAKNIIHSLDAAPYHLKFMIDKTEVSLFTSTPLTDDPTTHHEKHSSLKLDNITEILSKKLLGRVMNLGEFAKRDFYDFCVACHKTPESFTAALNILKPRQLTEIADEVKDWRNSPLIRQSDKDKPLLEPVYQELADNVWRLSEDVIRHNTVPERLFTDIPPTKQLSR